MKKHPSLSVFLGMAVFFLTTLTVFAQDWKNVNPKMIRVLADTTFARATEVTLQPGEKSEMHSHAAHFFYALSEGKMMVHYKDGKHQLYEFKPGESDMSGPERPHTSENVGTTVIKFMLVELKEHPYKEPKKK